MGISINPNTFAVDVVMNTSPQGNYVGQFKDNVLAPVPTPTPVPTPIPIPNPIQVNKGFIIDSLYRIITAIQYNQSKSRIIKMVYDLISFISKI
jgi:hypothetical protein